MNERQIRVICCSILSIASYNVNDGSYAGLFSSFSNATLLVILGSRLLFNLKEEGERNMYATMATQSSTLVSANIHFAEQRSEVLSTVIEPVKYVRPGAKFTIY